MDENEQLVCELTGILLGVREALPELLRSIAAVLEPPSWPQAEMNFVYRFLAEEAGLPARCPQPACRRAGKCRSGLARRNTGACAALWSGVEAEKLETAYLALAVGWTFEAQRRRKMAGMVLASPLVAESAPPDSGPR